jgi:predicted transglutaminase-like cysteine proteinase
MHARRLALLGLIGLAACAPGLEVPALQDASWLAPGPPVAPPAGFISFCVREKVECAFPAGSPPARLDEATASLLADVNWQVNSETVLADDMSNHGAVEYWGIVRNGRGDCDDMAVTKRSILRAAGLPLSDLRLALVLTPSERRHVVLTVVTDRGDLVLDSETSVILPWQEAGYRWLMRQDGTQTGWIAIGETVPSAPPGRGCPVYEASVRRPAPLVLYGVGL